MSWAMVSSMSPSAVARSMAAAVSPMEPPAEAKYRRRMGAL
jgi:hypothetical protein